MTDPTNADLARQLLTHTLNDVEAHDDPERLRETQVTLTAFVEEDLAGRHPMVIAYTAQYAAQLAAWGGARRHWRCRAGRRARPRREPAGSTSYPAVPPLPCRRG
jgi:hypothetical protein